MNIWQELYRFAESRAPSAIETTLLGLVPYVVVDGRYESQIPWQLQDEANRNGLRIIAADYRRNAYVIELLPRVVWLSSNAPAKWPGGSLPGPA